MLSSLADWLGIICFVAGISSGWAYLGTASAITGKVKSAGGTFLKLFSRSK